MHAHLSALAAALCATAAAQSPSYCDAKFSNDFDVVSTATSPNTGRNLPVAALIPGGYLTTGVTPGHRVYTYIPDERYQGGNDPFRRNAAFTVTGFTQTIFVGPEVVNFPTTTETYQMETGIAPAEQWSSYWRHTSDGTLPDLVTVPSSTLTVPSAADAIYDHSFTLATPIPITPQPELILYVAYRGGEMQNDPNGGQSLECDWRGALGMPGQQYFGFASVPNASNVRTVQASFSPYMGKIGLLTDEPVFHMGGYHGNRYDAGARSGERFRGVTIIANDWGNQTWANSQATMWFDFEGGLRYAGGMFTPLFSLDAFWWPAALPFGFGNLLLNPGDPLLFGFPQAGALWTLDPNGTYDLAAGAALTVPPFGPGAIGLWIKTQGLCANVDPVLGFVDIALSNAVSTKIIN